MKNYYVLGLMSGTSIDGIDLVYANFVFNKYWSFKILESKTYQYNNDWQKILKNLSDKDLDSIKLIDKSYTKLLSKYILKFIDDFSIKKIDFISSHGHTALHDPLNSITYQIGNLKDLSAYIGLKVICDFRLQDVKLGGQGAPLVPVGEKYIFPEYDTLINLGGFANITIKSNNNLIAYDICPVNIVFNHLSNLIDLKYDHKGKIALSGKLNIELFNCLQSLDYYKQVSPKSLGVEWVNQIIFPIINSFSEIPLEDLLNTFSKHFASQIADNIKSTGKILITGGGAYNDYLIQNIKDLTGSEIIIPNSEIIEYKEALIFGFLGVLKDLNINNCYSSVTGAIKDHSSGNIFIPKI
ncbi:MAG: anhydro-N-acetylmuramic acid kinase [Flavobacteriaceae bacterium]|nr:anhydro-N-acetylmuramic acid kinase [Flavobacteriaceae bacterium]